METNANQKVSCVANYAYDASENDELTIRPGDVLRDVERLPGGWWRGELRGRRGMFPDNFVSLLTDNANSRSAGVQGRCRAVFSYQPANPDELPLCVGDVLEVLGEVEEGWWQGRRQGRVGVFPSNFVVMLDPPQPAPPAEPAPALPPKPVKEQCRVLFPYSAVNDDELTLAEGDVVTIVSKDAPDRGWWRGELHGRVGLFPDNFVQLMPAVAADVEEKKPDRPPTKTTNSIYPVLNKYSEKTASVKELTTSKISLHKENTISKESSTQSTVTHTNKSESEKLIHSETVSDGTLEQVKKPPVPLKKSPTPGGGVGGLFSGLKSIKMLSSTDKEKSSSTTISSGSSSGGEYDRPDGGAASKPSATPNVTANSNTFDHVERNSILNDPRAGRVKAPRRRPPSQALRDDTPLQIGLSNGHEVPAEKPPPEKTEEIKPRTREWEKHRAPWMEELKLNQAKKTSLGDAGKARSVSTGGDGLTRAHAAGSTDRILDCGLDEKRSTHSMEMSKSTSSISSRMSVMESYEETKVRHSLDSKKEAVVAPREDPPPKPTLHSPTAAGRTLMNMLDEIKKPQAPPPPIASTRPSQESHDKSPNARVERTVTTEKSESIISRTTGVFEKGSTLERMDWMEERSERSVGDRSLGDRSLGDRSLGDRSVGDRSVGDRSLGDRSLGDRSLGDRSFGDRSLGDRSLGDRSLGDRSLGDRSLGDKSLGDRSVGDRSVGDRSVGDRSVGERSGGDRSVGDRSASGTLERRLQPPKQDAPSEKSEGTEALIAQLNSRISNLEKLIEVQNSMFNAALEDLTVKLKAESEKRQALQSEMEKLAHCVTQV